ncbi:hypothetical protein [Moritella viscosa]|uniref:Lipoprotein n=1 Tax=Moritella viscosa TaxID=80854 RepID=A0A1L0BMB8_9GAMM|nr:hypothetical protein [Moritella viscosa]SGY98991.1 Putative uncharacterized protein [Moritella viscosa]SGZ06062.1 Putative uncharacterized protein [Moritella viscosa]SGZ13613.1 Putative uncharacterized protein [Moritella viscosa]SGZ19139.1 Putative uncharacterized protein [Moritella viscosa]SHO13458.1 Putative uncharacterized protein [Moritella viscosa]
MKTIFKCALLASTTILLSACGGGGSGGTQNKVVPPTEAIIVQSGLYKVDGQEAFLMVSQQDKTKPAILSYKDLRTDPVTIKKLVSFALVFDDTEITDQSFITAMGYFKIPNTQNIEPEPVQVNITGTSPLSLEWINHNKDSDSLGNMSRSILQSIPVTSLGGTWENGDVSMTINNSNVEITTSKCNVSGELLKDFTTYYSDNITGNTGDCRINGLVMMSHEHNWFVTFNRKDASNQFYKLTKK